MRMNREMERLMHRFGVKFPLSALDSEGKLPPLVQADDCAFLKSEYERNQHLNPADFPDKTTFEDFVNHVHFPFAQTKESLLGCLRYATSIAHSLANLPDGRQFRVILAISQNDLSPEFACTVRFHTVRSGEESVVEDLENYKVEAVLVLDVPEAV